MKDIFESKYFVNLTTLTLVGKYLKIQMLQLM